MSVNLVALSSGYPTLMLLQEKFQSLLFQLVMISVPGIIQVLYVDRVYIDIIDDLIRVHRSEPHIWIILLPLHYVLP